MGDVVFHIGFPKTATTTLQSTLMACPACHYLGKGLRDTMEPSLSLEIARAVFFADVTRFEAVAPTLAEQLAALAEERSCLVVSDEAFSFAEHMKIGRQWGRQVVTDHKVIAARLARLSPDAKIMMSARNQMSFLKSFFRQSIKGGGFSGTFEEYISREIDARTTRSMLHLLRYDEAFSAYADLFGAEKILVSLYEGYSGDFGLYLDQTADFCGLEAAALRQIWGGRHDNKAKQMRSRREMETLISLVPPVLRKAVPSGVKDTLKRKTAKAPEPAEFTGPQEALLRDWFAPSNQALAQITGLDLASYGYPGMAPAPQRNRDAV